MKIMSMTCPASVASSGPFCRAFNLYISGANCDRVKGESKGLVRKGSRMAAKKRQGSGPYARSRWNQGAPAVPSCSTFPHSLMDS